MTANHRVTLIRLQGPTSIHMLVTGACKGHPPMTTSRKKQPPYKLAPWVDAKRRHRLSDTQIQMARELGMSPKKLGKLDNHKQEPWKASLSEFIDTIYRKRFKREKPEQVTPIPTK